MRSFTFSLLLALGFIVMSFSAEAQRFTPRKRYWSIGVALNGMNYFGDIVPKTSRTNFDPAETKPEFAFFVTRRIWPNISFRGSLAYGALTGNDYKAADGENFAKDFSASSEGLVDQDFRLFRNQHFRNRIAEVSGTVIIDFIQNRGMYFRRPDKPIPYVFFGFALGVQNPKAQIPLESTIDEAYNEPVGTLAEPEGEWVSLRKYNIGEAKPGPLFVAIPFGLGVRYKLSKKVDIAFEAGFRYTFTDLLDGVSGNYIEIDRDNDRTAYYLANRSTLNRSAPNSINENDRSAIITAMEQVYGTDASLLGYSNPATNEIRGKSGFGNNDQYMVYGIQLSYILAYDVKCPKFR